MIRTTNGIAREIIPGDVGHKEVLILGIPKKYYDLAYSSLRENLIPMEAGIKQIEEMESGGPFHLSIDPEIPEMKMHQLYMVPYVAEIPMWKAMFLGDESSDTSVIEVNEGDEARWMENVKRRITPFMKCALHTNLVSKIDSNFDYGCIIHMLSGRVYPFDYSKVKCFEISSMLHATAVAMNMVGEGIRDISGVHVPNAGLFHGWYRPIFHDGVSGDEFHSASDEPEPVIPDLLLSQEDLDKTATVLCSLFEKHVKCIVIE